MDEGDWDLVSQEFKDAFMKVVNEKTWPLYIFGEAGRGKTFSAAAIYRRWPDSTGTKPRWIDFQPWLRLVMTARRDGTVWQYHPATKTSSETTENGLMLQIANASVVFLDDCGIRSDSDAQQSAFLEILNIRKGHPLIITGNHEPKVLHKVFDSRIASRLMSGTMFKVSGPDRRMQGTKVIEVST